MDKKEFKEYYDQIIWLQYSVILPDQKKISKEHFVTKRGFDHEGFKKYIFEIYTKSKKESNDQIYYI